MKRFIKIIMSALMAVTIIGLSGCSSDEPSNPKGHESFTINGKTYYNLAYNNSWISLFETDEYDSDNFLFNINAFEKTEGDHNAFSEIIGFKVKKDLITKGANISKDVKVCAVLSCIASDHLNYKSGSITVVEESKKLIKLKFNQFTFSVYDLINEKFVLYTIDGTISFTLY